jgi:hypothetical protein
MKMKDGKRWKMGSVGRWEALEDAGLDPDDFHFSIFRFIKTAVEKIRALWYNV